MRHIYATLVLCSCTDVNIIPAEGGGGSAPDPAGGAPTIPSDGGSVGDGGVAGDGGSGGQPSTRTIVIDLDAPEGADRNEVVVLVQANDGTVSGTWFGGELPIDAPVNDGDLVTYLYTAGSSYAAMYRVTPEVTEVRTEAWLGTPDEPCAPGAPMTLYFEIPEVEDGNSFEVRLAGASLTASAPIQSGANEAQVTACAGTTSFDMVVVAKEYANTPPLAVARVNDIPFLPSATWLVPVELSTERALLDIVVEAEPGTSFAVDGRWYNESFAPSGYSVTSSMIDAVGDGGTASLSYGPFALGSGESTVSARVPSGYWSCELDWAWKTSPFDGMPLHARLGTLASFAPQPDGHVALAAEGEAGDVIVRTEDDYASNDPAYWAIYEAPQSSYPLPVKPEVPSDLLPGFNWPGPNAEMRYIHHDFGPTEGYADYAATAPTNVDGRSLHRVPLDCP